MGAFEESRKWYRQYDEPIQEYERLARNRPSERIDPTLPRVTDGTLAALNQEGPKRIVQQVPSGLAVCKTYPEYAALATYLLDNKLIPLSCKMGSELQKSWQMIGKAGQVGSSTSYSYLTVIDGEMYVEWILPYVKDVFGEKGKTFMPDSNVRFMRSWYQKTDLQAIIAKEKKMKDKNSKYVSDWDLTKLALFINEGPTSKNSEEMTPAEREKGDGHTGGYEVIHAFQNGKGADFFSFSPRYNDGETLRTKTSKDPRGKMPLDDMYWNIDHSNPRGRGQIELSGGIQNLIDNQLQAFQFNSTYMQAPALMVWGSVNKASLKIRPNTIWDMGSNPNNKVERDVIDNIAIGNFVPNMQFLQSKIYNLNSSQDNSIAAGTGDVNQSKTQAGVKASESKLGVSDNYIRKQFEEFWGNMSETRLNIYLSEMTGTSDPIKLDADDLKKISDSASAKFLNDKKELVIPYKAIDMVKFKFQVDGGSSEIKEDLDNAEKLTEVYKLMVADPDPEIMKKKKQVLKVLIDEIGAEGTDDLFPELKETDKDGNPIEPEQQAPAGPDPEMIMQMVQQAVQEAMAQKPQDDPMLKIFKDLPEDAKQQLLQKYGMESQVDSPTERKLDIEAQAALGQAERDEIEAETSAYKLVHEEEQTQFNNEQADRSSSLSEAQALQQAEQAREAAKQAKQAKQASKQPVGAKS